MIPRNLSHALEGIGLLLLVLAFSLFAEAQTVRVSNAQQEAAHKKSEQFNEAKYQCLEAGMSWYEVDKSGFGLAYDSGPSWTRGRCVRGERFWRITPTGDKCITNKEGGEAADKKPDLIELVEVSWVPTNAHGRILRGILRIEDKEITMHGISCVAAAAHVPPLRWNWRGHLRYVIHDADTDRDYNGEHYERAALKVKPWTIIACQ